jgi:hypothetical protein
LHVAHTETREYLFRRCAHRARTLAERNVSADKSAAFDARARADEDDRAAGAISWRTLAATTYNFKAYKNLQSLKSTLLPLGNPP